MLSTLRKILVGLVSLAVVVVAFVIYNNVSRTPKIDLTGTGQSALPETDGNDIGGALQVDVADV